MGELRAWKRKVAGWVERVPMPPAGSPNWLGFFTRCGHVFRLPAREPDFAAALAAYRALRPPYGDEAAGLHAHLLELVLRAADGVPPCSAAEFGELAAWLAEHGRELPTAGGWKQELDLGGGKTTTLSDLARRVKRGPTVEGSGEVAQMIRRLKARHEGGPLPAEPDVGGGAAVTPGWVPSVVRDGDEEEAGLT